MTKVGNSSMSDKRLGCTCNNIYLISNSNTSFVSYAGKIIVFFVYRNFLFAKQIKICAQFKYQYISDIKKQ